MKFMTYILKLIGIEVIEDYPNARVQRVLIQCDASREDRRVRKEWMGG